MGQAVATEAEMCDLLRISRKTLQRMRRPRAGKPPLLIAGTHYLQQGRRGHLRYFVRLVVQEMAERSRKWNSPLA